MRDCARRCCFVSRRCVQCGGGRGCDVRLDVILPVLRCSCCHFRRCRFNRTLTARAAIPVGARHVLRVAAAARRLRSRLCLFRCCVHGMGGRLVRRVAGRHHAHAGKVVAQTRAERRPALGARCGALDRRRLVVGANSSGGCLLHCRRVRGGEWKRRAPVSMGKYSGISCSYSSQSTGRNTQNTTRSICTVQSAHALHHGTHRGGVVRLVQPRARLLKRHTRRAVVRIACAGHRRQRSAHAHQRCQSTRSTWPDRCQSHMQRGARTTERTPCFLASFRMLL